MSAQMCLLTWFPTEVGFPRTHTVCGVVCGSANKLSARARATAVGQPKPRTSRVRVPEGAQTMFIYLYTAICGGRVCIVDKSVIIIHSARNEASCRCL